MEYAAALFMDKIENKIEMPNPQKEGISIIVSSGIFIQTLTTEI